MNTITTYFKELAERFGAEWNRFWYTAVDPFPACVLRALTGVVALYTVLTFGPDLATFFGPDGLVSSETARAWQGDPYSVDGRTFGEGGLGLSNLSYFHLVHSPSELTTVHVLGVVVLVLFTAGAFTRVMSVLALLVMLSYFNRAPMLSGPLESLLAFVMFYLCIAPCGKYLSIDAWRERRARAASNHVALHAGPERSVAANIALRLIQVHLSLFVLMMGLSKLDGGAWSGGEAVWMLIARYETCPFDLTWLHRYPLLLNLWSHVILGFELLFPILIWNRWARPLLIGLTPLVSLSAAVLTGLFAFAVMLSAATLAFAPADALRNVTDALWRRSATEEEEPAVSEEKKVGVAG